MQERWMNISDAPDYEVSDQGRVRSLKFGKVKILRPGKTGRGYLTVALCKRGNPHTRKIHRLVMDAFVGPCPGGMMVNHISGEKTDNRQINLEYVTQSENGYHAYRKGLRVPSVSQCKKIRQLDKNGKTITKYVSVREAARLTGVDNGSISKCCRGLLRTAGGFVWAFAEG